MKSRPLPGRWVQHLRRSLLHGYSHKEITLPPFPAQSASTASRRTPADRIELSAGQIEWLNNLTPGPRATRGYRCRFHASSPSRGTARGLRGRQEIPAAVHGAGRSIRCQLKGDIAGPRV